MKVTRYINGKKVEKEVLKEIVVSNELILGTIARVNQRFSDLYGKDRNNK